MFSFTPQDEIILVAFFNQGVFVVCWVWGWKAKDIEKCLRLWVGHRRNAFKWQCLYSMGTHVWLVFETLKLTQNWHRREHTANCLCKEPGHSAVASKKCVWADRGQCLFKDFISQRDNQRIFWCNRMLSGLLKLCEDSFSCVLTARWIGFVLLLVRVHLKKGEEC